MYVRCASCQLRIKPAFVQKSEEEIYFIETLKSDHLKIAAGTEFIHPEQDEPELYTLYSGWVYRYKEIADGRRQILNFSLPGDLIGLQASLFGKSLFGAVALTDVELCVIPRRRLLNLFERMPEIAYDVTWLGSRSESLVEENLLTVGRRSAAERITAMIATLYKRAEALGLVVDGALELPLTQQHIADALGLSLVHTNKTLARLRSQKLFSLVDGRLVVQNLRGVSRFAQHFEEEIVPRPIV
jgi:CRP-like cAMP-binding protein